MNAGESTNSKLGLPPVIWESSRILILGTMPGEESLLAQRYYANSRNDFWRILSAVYAEVMGTDYNRRLEFLRRKGLALWDILRSCERVGSADRTIKNPVPNDFGVLFDRYPLLEAVALNGGKAKTFFKRYGASQRCAARFSTLRIQVLPSTSPAPGKHVLPFAEKVARWTVFLA